MNKEKIKRFLVDYDLFIMGLVFLVLISTALACLIYWNYQTNIMIDRFFNLMENCTY